MNLSYMTLFFKLQSLVAFKFSNKFVIFQGMIIGWKTSRISGFTLISGFINITFIRKKLCKTYLKTLDYLGQLESLKDFNQGRDLIRFVPYEKD